MSSNDERVKRIFDCTKEFFKVEQPDAHIRMVRASNCLTELKAGAVLSEDERMKLLDMLLKMMEKDAAKICIGAAAECIAFLVKTDSEKAIETVYKRLGLMLMDSGKGSLKVREARDYAEICLIQCIANTPKKRGAMAMNAVTMYVVTGCQQKKDIALTQESTRVLLELLKKFSAFLNPQQRDAVQKCLWDQTSSADEAILSNLPQAIGHLAAFCDSNATDKIVRQLQSGLNKAYEKANLADMELQLRILRSVAVHAPNFGKFIVAFSDLLFKIVKLESNAEDDDAIQASYRLRASSLDVFGAFITSSPRQIEKCVDDIIETCMENLKFDPNFNEMDDETESKLADQMDVDDPFADDPFGDDGGADMFEDETGDNDEADEDSSWKIRKAAADTIKSLVVSKPTLLKKLYLKCCENLAERFSERIGTTAVSVIQCFDEMLKASFVIDDKVSSSGSTESDAPVPPNLARVASATDELLGMVKSQVIMDKILEQLKECSVDVKAEMFSMLRTFFVVLNKKKVLSSIDQSKMDVLADAIVESLNEPFGVGVSSMKCEALKLVQTICKTFDKNVLSSVMDKIYPHVYGRINKQEENQVKETALLTVKCALDCSKIDSSNFAMKLAKVIHRVVTKKAALQPVRLAGIAACGSLIARLGNHKDVSIKVADMLKSNLDRMNVDTFHCAVLKSFSTIASAEVPIENIETEMRTLETKIINECMDKEAVHEAVLQLARLRTLKDLAAAYTTKTKIVSDEKLIIQFSKLVNDSTVAMAQAVLELAVIVQKYNEACTNGLVINALQLICSDLVRSGDGGVSSLYNLLQTFIRKQVNGSQDGFKNLLDACWHLRTNAVTSKNLALTVAQCAADTGSDCSQYVDIAMEKIENSKDVNVKITAINILGALGRQINITKSGKVVKCILNISKTNSNIENVAAEAYGSVAYGASDTMLPDLITQAKEGSGFALVAIREMLKIDMSSEKSQINSSFLSELLEIVPNHFSSDNEHTRTCAVELGGFMLSQNAESTLNCVMKAFGETSDKERTARVQTSCLNSIKFAIVLTKQLPQPLKKHLATLLSLKHKSEDEKKDAKVARAAVELLQRICELDSSWISKIDKNLSHDLIQHLENRKDLIVEVQMGQMKMKHDIGRDLRIATCHCISKLEEFGVFDSSKDIVNALVQHSERDIRKSAVMELNDVVVAQFDMLGYLLPRTTSGSTHYNPEKGGLLNRALQTHKKLCSGAKNAKVEQALRRFLESIRSAAAGESKFVELDRKLSTTENEN